MLIGGEIAPPLEAFSIIRPPVARAGGRFMAV
jgi:hypothetical protein